MTIGDGLRKSFAALLANGATPGAVRMTESMFAKLRQERDPDLSEEPSDECPKFCGWEIWVQRD